MPKAVPVQGEGLCRYRGHQVAFGRIDGGAAPNSKKTEELRPGDFWHVFVVP